MDPFVVNPAAYNKDVAFEAALNYVKGFLDHNSVAHPREYLTKPDDTKKPPGTNLWHRNGWCWSDVIFVNLKRSKVPVKNPGFSWSFTGFKADLTAPGILAHEVGHHVHFQYNRTHKAQEILGLLDSADSIRKREAPVSSYEPNVHETIAEAARLFILNPKLLEEGRPLRYGFFTQQMGLKPVHQVAWREVLCHAHPRLIKAAEGWINR